MSNHLSDLLAQWYPNRDEFDWVLATIYDAKGPCYRKPGAMMLFSSRGDQLGMLSGGCLESDIATNARKVMHTKQSLLVCYDGSDEDDMSFHLGIGCGGTLYIMLQPINEPNNYLALLDVHHALITRVSGCYTQSVVGEHLEEQAYFEAANINDIAAPARLTFAQNNETNDEARYLVTSIVPKPHLLVVGGGIDAQPLVNMAHQLGWQVSLWDPRPANARKEYFTNVDHIIKGKVETLSRFVTEHKVNAAILMSHNIELDADALKVLSKTPLQYLALLGPAHRKQQVIRQAQLAEQSMPFVFAGPSGLDIGGTLPESIALSILAECHASLFNKKAHSISQIL